MRFASPDLLSAVSAGHTVITPSPLLASVVKEQFVQSQLRKGALAWHPPQILSLGAWLAESWQRALYAGPGIPTLLSPMQERTVWQELLQALHPRLFDYWGAVGLASAAALTLTEWHIPLDNESWSYSSDTKQFSELLGRFRQQAYRDGWMTRSDVWQLLPDWIETSWFREAWLPSGTIVFAGFAAVSPSLAALVGQLGSRAKLLLIEPPKTGKPCVRVEFKDAIAELEFAARWTREQYEKNPDASLAIVVSDLAGRTRDVKRVLRHVFYGGSAGQASDTPELFHVDAPEPLSDHPLIVSALLLLELTQPRLATANAGAILRSAYLAGAREERSQRAVADVQLRRDRDLDVSLADLMKASSQCGQLQNIWQRVKNHLQTMRPSADLAEWSQFIGHLATETGWPGDRELNASEQQAMEGWGSTLNDLSALGLVVSACSFSEAAVHLRSLLATRTTSSGDLSSPVQVIDAAVADGLRFDCAAIVGLSDDAWPLNSRASPFIPFALQRPILAALDSARRDATAQLFCIAPSLVCTYSGSLAPLAEPFTRTSSRRPSVWNGHVPGESSVAFDVEELLDDTEAPAFALTGNTVPGGVSILKSQSQCPFQAFAKYRLSARRPEDACFGFDARERGSFLHRALENVWRQLRTRDQLQATSLEDRRQIVHQAVAAAVRSYTDSPFHELAGQAERERLEELILEWLTIEERRTRPFTVEHIEKDETFEIEGLRLNLRIDRIDRLPDGSSVLVDYKSGEPKLKSLDAPRPSEPQLLVYASAIREPVEGVFFAQLKPRALKAIGYSRAPQFPVSKRLKKNAGNDWDDFLAASKDAVHEIATEFTRGWAAVDPQPGACTFCNIKPFCRINEQGSGEETDDAD